MRQKIFDILDSLKIEYDNYEHDAVFTCNENKGVKVPGKRVKSLLLRNKKSTNFYMIVLPDYKKLDTNIIRGIFNDSKISFASEEQMLDKIGLKPGSVSPFALINNLESDIKVVFDKCLEEGLVGFHPLQNDNTVVLEMKYVKHFLDNLGIEFFFNDL
ncbi:prolyl-tRNA editing protein [Candidatus Gracilibacteria bacterium]|nr:MAG: prolyl-tRNA editing protein [Candidatus Gracilibacteria bacterium]PIE85646.1 MAG: prolyl-tRNA editing protein [Candidatus Gracilibacteria bacterium]